MFYFVLRHFTLLLLDFLTDLDGGWDCNHIENLDFNLESFDLSHNSRGCKVIFPSI